MAAGCRQEGDRSRRSEEAGGREETVTNKLIKDGCP